MWQALKALWGKIAGQAPPVPSAAPTRKPVPSASQAKPPLRDNFSTRATTPVPQPPAQPAAPRDPLSRLADPASTPPNKAWDAFSAVAAAEKPADLQMGGEFPKVMQSPILPAQPTPTAESINSFGAKSDIGSRISSMASSTDSGRAVSSISMARLHQPE